MNRETLIEQIKKKQSYLCVGLDTDRSKIPAHLLEMEDPIFEFNKAIIDATKQFAVAYKPNLAFYEAEGIEGWKSLQKTVEYIPDNIFTIADAKRGDIGNTAERYAKTFFQQFNFDSVTVSPYMGSDSVKPFLQSNGKWVILLALTSNKGAEDFQFIENIDGKALYEQVIEKSSGWGTKDNLMYVVGATRPEYIAKIRKLAPDHFLLVPGVGAQGGSLKDISEAGLNADTGLLINSSRSIIYASSGKDFAAVAGQKAKELQEEMSQFL
jgi:orotidine-5'-phosphate decarboxylase